ncbi:MAG: ArsB/NhaD family transporter [Candidatus Thermoplasmatota archaeon]
MHGKIIVEIVFLFSCVIMIYLILRRPYLYIRLGIRRIRLDTYFIGALLSPLLLLVLGLLDYSQVLRGLQGEAGLNPFGILLLFLSMVFMSIFLDVTGFFEYCARLALLYAKGDGKRLFFSMYMVVSVLTIFTSNDIIILTFTPFIYYFSKHAGIDPKPYLIAEFFAANTWSMMLYIGNPTNIILASAFHLYFDEYLRWMLLPALSAGFVNMIILYMIFRRSITQPLRYVKMIKPSEAITDRVGAVLGVTILSGCIVALALAPYVGVEMWIVSLSFALLLLIVLVVRDSYHSLLRSHLDKKNMVIRPTIKRMPFGIIPFVGALFITVEALRSYGVMNDMGLFLTGIVNDNVMLSVLTVGFSSAFAANALNNIPMTVAYVPIISVLPSNMSLSATLATAVGSNLGANITPIGALAGIMWMGILREKQVKVTFTEFTKYGLIATPVTLLVCLGVLGLQFLLF